MRSKTDAATENRRKFARYSAGSTEIRVKCKGESLVGTVIDESIGGICLCVPDHPSWEPSIGDAMEFHFRDQDGTAYVRSAESDGEQTRVGLSWDPPPSVPGPIEQTLPQPDDADPPNDDAPNDDAPSFEITEQVFYQHGDLSVVCDVVGISKSGQVKVQIDGEQAFLTESRQIVTRSRAERLVDLQCQQTLQSLSAFYEIESTAEAVVAHEFR